MVLSSASIPRRLGALLKATSADWQVNEIPADVAAAAAASKKKIGREGAGSSDSAVSFFVDPVAVASNSLAEPLFLTKMPKGRWRKIAGRVVKKVETDPAVPFSDPSKHFQELATSFGTYVYRRGKVPQDGNRDTLVFSVYRESTPWRAVLRRMKQRLHLTSAKMATGTTTATAAAEEEEVEQQRGGEEESAGPLVSEEEQLTRRVAVASPKESFGCVTQLGHVRNISAEVLPHASRHYNINPVLFNPIKFVQSDFMSDGGSNCHQTPVVAKVATPIANRWRVMLRCVDGSQEEIAEALERVAQSGAINYFPLRCFGASSGGSSSGGVSVAVDCATALETGRYFDACSIWLRSEAEKDFLFQPYYRQYLAADPSAVRGVLSSAAAELKDQRASDHLVQFLTQLADISRSTAASNAGALLTDDLCKQLWQQVIEPSSSAVDHAALAASPARFLWNLAASQRLYQYGSKAVVGDFVVVVNDHDHGGAHGGCVVRQVQEGESSNFSLEDVLVPMPSSAGADRSWYSDFFKNAANRFDMPVSVAGNKSSSFRRLILRPLGGQLDYKIVKDPNSLSLLKTDLFLRQERKSPQSVSLEERFREPTLFNVSDAFRVRMQPVLHKSPPPSSSSASLASSAATARCSVAIECDLPSGETHILPLLREAFLLRHLHYHDMFDFCSTL